VLLWRVFQTAGAGPVKASVMLTSGEPNLCV